MELEDRIFNAYIELKSEPLVSRIKTGMFAGDFSWGRCLQPTDARDYVKAVILELVIIHAQVRLSSLVSKDLVYSRDWRGYNEDKNAHIVVLNIAQYCKLRIPVSWRIQAIVCTMNYNVIFLVARYFPSRLLSCPGFSLV